MRSAVRWLIGSGIPCDPHAGLGVAGSRSEIQRLADDGALLPIPVVRPFPSPSQFSYEDAVGLLLADVEQFGECER